ncbi:hypothetical protein AQ505_08800 [Pedobacter sp. PACM 27299]|uniref:hypothetical protein n=1 Tax=Pedobacter sp. PACM 27299 TaxID=1727164 RepID=UPI000706781C|nr:hypothetical protein [Pedobacter sp. PACM 27299]ALL05580.1 hypothetical protein AQ505_08800 [Pedobacter sp. PACM 27299]
MGKNRKPIDEVSKKRLVPKDNKAKSSHDRLQPKDTSSVKKVFWTFGFKYYTQIDLFGLSNVDVPWFVALLDRLRDTSKMEYTGMTQVLEEGYRYHEINWSQKNIPLQREEFKWVLSDYLNNELEYPFCQFHISKGTGRIVGFWDESNIFQIILLDPLHNLQPSKFNDYELRECYPAKSQFDSLQFEIDEILRSNCSVTSCSVFEKLRTLPTGRSNINVVVAHLDNDFHKSLGEVLKHKTLSEIIEAGVLSLTD